MYDHVLYIEMEQETTKGDLLTYHSLNSFNFMIAEIPSALFRFVVAAASQWILHAIDIANTRSEQIH